MHEREVFGIAGVEGNGQEELVDGLIGLREADVGTIRIDGGRSTRHRPKSSSSAAARSFPRTATTTASRSSSASLDNLLMKDFRRPEFCRRGIINYRHAGASLRAPDRGSTTSARPISTSRSASSPAAISRRPCSRASWRASRGFVALQPTRGLDVGAAEFVYGRLNEQKRAGARNPPDLFELDEIFSLSDRFAVISSGRFLRVLETADTDLETVGMLMGGEQTG